MGQGRHIIYFSLAFIVGDVTAALYLPSLSGAARVAMLFLSCFSTLFALYLFTRSRAVVWFLSAAFFLGTISAAVGGLPLKESALAAKGAELQSKFSEYLERLLSEDHNGESAILKALIAGDKSSVDKELKESYRQSGAMHLLALSGLHVGIIYALLSLMLSLLGNSHVAKRIKCALMLSILWSYAIITGFGPSIERAVMMITIYETGVFVSGERDMLCALAISAFISTLLEPAAPFSVGFMLSYSAMLGIRFILPQMLPLLKTQSRLLQGVWSIIAMSISCQITTAPLSYLFFGTFPRYFMVTNLTLMPLTSLVIYGAPITISLDFLIPEWDFPSIALSMAIKLMNSIVSLISTM